MKKMKTRLLGLFMAAVMMFSAPVSVDAAQTDMGNGTVVVTEDAETVYEGEYEVQEELKFASTPAMAFPKEIKLHTGSGGIYVYGLTNMPVNGQIKSVKISNKKIAEVSARKNGIAVKAKKAGTATVTFSVKYGNKTKKFSTKLKVYKYINPIKSYVIGGLEIKSKYKNITSCNLKISKDMSVKFNVKAKSGWKISSFTYRCNGVTTRYATNSPIIKLKKVSGSSVQINFQNKKTGLIENIVLWIRV